MNEVEIRTGPDVAYVGLVNREGTGADRVTVSIAATLQSVVRTSAGHTIYRDEDEDRNGLIDVSEYWTLARSGEGWRLVLIEQEAEGAHHLEAAIVAAPWSDDARLSDATLVELATSDAPPPEVAVSELVSVEFEGTAREKALDLALADPRCAPDVLEVGRGGPSRRGPRRSTATTQRCWRSRRPRRARCCTPAAASSGASSCAARGCCASRSRRCTRTAHSRAWRSRRTSAGAATSRIGIPPRCCRATRIASASSPSAGRSRSTAHPTCRGG